MLTFFFVGYENKHSKYVVEKVMIWQHFLISGKHKVYHFLIFVFCLSQIKNYIITGLVWNFLNAPCKRVTFSLQKRKHHKMGFKVCLEVRMEDVLLVCTLWMLIDFICLVEYFYILFGRTIKHFEHLCCSIFF